MRLSEEPVSSWMTLQPVSVDREAPIDRVLSTFAKYPFRHLPVTGGNELFGILSDRDVLLATGWLSDAERTVDDESPSPHVVQDIMTANVRTLSRDATLGEAARVILGERIGALPVVDDVGLLGIVTETDLLQALHDASEMEEAQVLARDLMKREVATTTEDEDLLNASEILLRSRIRHLPVVRGNQVVGMLSDRDVRLGLARLSWQDNRVEHEGDASIPRLSVCDVMTEKPFTIAPDATAARAISCMVEEQLGALPVVENGRLAGILSRTDLLELFLADALTARP